MKRTLLYLLFLFFILPLSGQDDTIVEQGVIHVRRPPVPAKFRVNIKYYYGDYSLQNPKIKKISKNEILLSDSVPGILSPQPYDIASDTREGELLRSFLNTSYPSEPFDWEKYLADLPFAFAWDDSLMLDSARFMLDISADGAVTLKPMPWKSANQETRFLEKNATTLMNRCVYWYPARILTGRKKKKTRNIASTIIITIYAYDAMEGRIKPLEIVSDPK